MKLDAQVKSLLIRSFSDPSAHARTIAVLFVCWIVFRWVATAAIVFTLWWAIFIVALLFKVLAGK